MEDLTQFERDLARAIEMSLRPDLPANLGEDQQPVPDIFEGFTFVPDDLLPVVPENTTHPTPAAPVHTITSENSNNNNNNNNNNINNNNNNNNNKNNEKEAKAIVPPPKTKEQIAQEQLLEAAKRRDLPRIENLVTI